MTFICVLWLAIWASLFSGIYNVYSPRFLADPMGFIQGARALLPVLAAYVACIRIMAVRSVFPFAGSSLGYLFYYFLVGLFSSLALSPDKLTALYWGTLFVAPLLVIWIVLEKQDPLRFLRRIITLNYVMVAVVILLVMPEAIRIGLGRLPFTQLYNLPFGIGEIRSNGVGRFVLVGTIVGFVRFLTTQGKLRYLWVATVPFTLFLLAQSQSRTSLLGLAVAAMLFVVIRGADWRLLFAVPVATYVIWLSGIRWRVRGDLSRLMNLTGREYTWQRGIEKIKQSPVFGWGFHGDRIMLNSEHMHNSYLHAMINSGGVGVIFFSACLFAVWRLIMRENLIPKLRSLSFDKRAWPMECILILGFLTARSFFESTAAFFGVDLLLLIPAIAYLYTWAEALKRENAESATNEQAGSHGSRSLGAATP